VLILSRVTHEAYGAVLIATSSHRSSPVGAAKRLHCASNAATTARRSGT